MEGKYPGCVRNRFQLICEEELDPFDILEQSERLQKLNLQDSKSKHDYSSENLAPVVDSTTKSGPVSSKGKAKDRGSVCTKVLHKSTEDIEERNKIENEPPRDRDPSSDSGFWIKHEKKKAPSRYKFRGGMAGRDRMPRDGFNGRGKREFDRQSGSPKSRVKPIEKRDGGGAHNWGHPYDNLEATREVMTEGSAAESLGHAESNVEEDTFASGDPETGKEMTFDEWKVRERGNQFVPAYSLRKPGEGEDTSQWKELHVLKKKTEDEHPAKCHASVMQRSQKKRSSKSATTPEAIGCSAIENERRGGRRFRPNVRAHEVVSADSTPVSQMPVPKFDDMNDFPSLGST